MNKVVCPHCGSHKAFVSRPPKDVVVVMPCPACHELVVLFRDNAIGLDRKIIEHGTREQRVSHYAEIIDKFMEAGLLTSDAGDPEMGKGILSEFVQQAAGGRDREETAFAMPITQEEVDRFIRIDLKCIDNATYFKRHFGAS